MSASPTPVTGDRLVSSPEAVALSPSDPLRSAAEEMVQAYIDAEAGNEFNGRMEAAYLALRAALSAVTA